MTEQTTFGSFSQEGEAAEPATIGNSATSPIGPIGVNWSNASDADVERAQLRRERFPSEHGESCPWCGAGDSAFREPPGDIGELSCGACGAIVPQ